MKKVNLTIKKDTYKFIPTKIMKFNKIGFQ